MNLPYSAEQIEDLYSKAKELVNRELPSDCFALFCDAYHTEMKDESRRIRKAVIYKVLGIDMQMKKDLYGYYVYIGSENKGDWLKIFNNLISRGLRKVMIVASDDFPWLSEAIKTLFPKLTINFALFTCKEIFTKICQRLMQSSLVNRLTE